MANKYCSLCQRGVETKRVIGVGTLIMCCLTLGFWVFLIPFYGQRCPICKGKSFGVPAEGSANADKIARQERKCPHCAEFILAEAKACRYCGRDVEPVDQSFKPAFSDAALAPYMKRKAD